MCIVNIDLLTRPLKQYVDYVPVREVIAAHEDEEDEGLGPDGSGDEHDVEIDHSSSSIAAAVEEQGIATSEINKRTQQAATRTREVATGISIMNTEAQETGRLSNEVMDSTSKIVSEMEALQLRMKQVIRESYAGDRRRSKRYQAPASVMIDLNGRKQSCAVKNISAGGVALDAPEISQFASVGTNLSVEISGYSNVIPGRIIDTADHKNIRVLFNISDEEVDKLDIFLAGLNGVRRAA